MTARIRTCVLCGGHERKVGPLSRKHKCQACALARVVASVKAMVDKDGEPYEKWLSTPAPHGRPRRTQGGSGGSESNDNGGCQ